MFSVHDSDNRSVYFTDIKEECGHNCYDTVPGIIAEGFNYEFENLYLCWIVSLLIKPYKLIKYRAYLTTIDTYC